jgi:hypothetical protein
METNNHSSFVLPRWLTLSVALISAPLAVHAALDTARIEQLTGLKGTYNQEEKVFKVSAPRTDIPIEVDGWAMPPFMGLTSWAAFLEGGKAEAMVAGDLVLMEDEVNSVMSVLLDAGLSVTALHNHFFFDKPRVLFMHIGGEGTVDQLATAVKAAFDKQKEIRAKKPDPAQYCQMPFAPGGNSITGKTVEEAIGVKGQAKDGMFKVVIGRTTKMPCGCDMTKEMGVNTWAAFGGTDDNAAVAGDFATTEDELQTVLKTLRAGKINIVAIHSHMTHENPRIMFLHYWGKGTTAALAKAIKAALDTQTK